MICLCTSYLILEMEYQSLIEEAYSSRHYEESRPMLSKDHKSLVYLTSYLMRNFTISNGTINTPVFKYCHKYCQAIRTVYSSAKVDISENSDFFQKSGYFRKSWFFQKSGYFIKIGYFIRLYKCPTVRLINCIHCSLNINFRQILKDNSPIRNNYFLNQLETIFLFLILSSMFSMFEFLFLHRFILNKNY